MIGVYAALPSYRAAVAELPARARLAAASEGAIAVLDGRDGWPAVAARVVAEGARAVVVHAPSPWTDTNAEALGGIAVPVVLARPMLRADVAADAAPSIAPIVVSIEVTAPARASGAALADAVGWARVLTGGPLRMSAARAADSGILSLLENESSGCPVSLVATERLDARGASRLRATAIAVERTEVAVHAGRADVSRSDDRGTLQLPHRHETLERLALRRAIAALDGVPARDLDEWDHDGRIAAAIRATGAPA